MNKALFFIFTVSNLFLYQHGHTQDCIGSKKADKFIVYLQGMNYQRKNLG